MELINLLLLFLTLFGVLRVFLGVRASLQILSKPKNKTKNRNKEYCYYHPMNNDKRSLSAHRGTLNLRIGPMFSGKTTWLNGELTQLADKGFSVLKITHADDVRCDVETCDDSGSTHNSSYKSLSDKIKRVRTYELKDIDVSEFHAIGVDESQFFPDLVEIIEDWVENQGKHVRVSGLDGDSFKRKFGQTLDLIPFSDEVIKLSASCRVCLDELEKSNFHGNILAIIGSFTKRLGTSTEQKVVGGSDQYIPVCRYHHSNPL